MKEIKSVEYFYNKMYSLMQREIEIYSDYGVYNQIDFLSDMLGLTTYDSMLSLRYAYEMAFTLDAIINKRQSEIMESKDKTTYRNYIQNLNSPFLREALNWGSSIRYCWIDLYGARPYKAFDLLDASDEDIEIITESESMENFFIAYVDLFIHCITNEEIDGFNNSTSIEMWNRRYEGDQWLEDKYYQKA